MKGMPVSNFRTTVGLALFIILILLPSTRIPAQSDTEPRTVHNACAGNCVADTNFIHSGMGDTQARYAYNAWFDSYYTLTGCDDPAWKTDVLFLIDIIGDAVGAPGAPTMQCWQGLAAQASLCSSDCNDYFIEDARYAPNVKLTLDQSNPGYLEVTLDNQSNLGKLPELQPNAYSRRFTLKTYLSYEDGEALLVNETAMPSLSFPNWTTRGGLDICMDEYGYESSRCQILANFDTPSITTASIEFLDGVFYDLSGQVSDLSDANGSFAQDGYIRLLSDGDSITIAQGPYAGYTLVKTHYLSSGTHTVRLQTWDAGTGAVTITNHECNSMLSTCWITGTRNETDTYVYAVQGPQDRLLEGSYSVQVVADIAHDKDVIDNQISYTYDGVATPEPDTGTDDPGGSQATGTPQDQPPSVEDLRIIDIPGPGTFPATIGADLLGYMFRLAVPVGLESVSIRLVALDGGQYTAFVRQGSIPVPNYPVIAVDYHCWLISDASYTDECEYHNPSAGNYFIFVHREQGGGAYQLEIEWTLPATPTPTPTVIPTTVPLATPTATPSQPDDAGTVGSLDETEPNDSYSEADNWDLQQPFNGELATRNDVDVLLLNFTQSGIYTFSLTDVGPDLRFRMNLRRASTHNTLDTRTAASPGEPVVLTLDASSGEQYYLIILPIGMDSTATSQPYTLSLSGFIPDPDEPNDDIATATLWDPAAGSLTGYFWDKTTGHHDYIVFVAPATLDGRPITFDLSNPAPDLRIRLTLLHENGLFISNTPYSAAGQPVTLGATLEVGTRYILKLETQSNATSLLPYTLSAQYTPGQDTGPDVTDTGRPFGLSGFVHQPGMPRIAVPGVTIYASVAGHAAIVVGITDDMGTYHGTVTVAEGQPVRIWAEKSGFTFLPEENVWWPEPRQRSHQANFVATGIVTTQSTPASMTATPSPTRLPRPTSVPTVSLTPPPPTSTPPPSQPATIISGNVWRLFPDSGPAGVGAAGVILTINDVEQPAGLSMIDGSYRIEATGLQPGDQLSLRATSPEDTFEPAAYQWQAESGVNSWQYDFYSYWGAITPPATDDQNWLYGYVRDATGRGVSGITLLVQMGTSDALQVLGPTNASGYYEGSVRLPSRIMVTVWPQAANYLPSRVQFFHAYAPENREVSFTQASGVRMTK